MWTERGMMRSSLSPSSFSFHKVQLKLKPDTIIEAYLKFLAYSQSYGKHCEQLVHPALIGRHQPFLVTHRPAEQWLHHMQQELDKTRSEGADSKTKMMNLLSLQWREVWEWRWRWRQRQIRHFEDITCGQYALWPIANCDMEGVVSSCLRAMGVGKGNATWKSVAGTTLHSHGLFKVVSVVT